MDDLAKVLGGGASLLVVATRMWVAHLRQRHRVEENEAPITLDLKPDRFAFALPQRDLIFSAEDRRTLNPSLTAALWYANELKPTELLDEAARLLEIGYGTPRLRVLAAQSATARRDLRQAADQAFAELDPACPFGRTQAISLLCEQVIERTANGNLPPHKAVQSISRLNNWELDGKFKQFAILNLQYEVALEQNPFADLRDLDRQTREACIAWFSFQTQESRSFTAPESVP